MNHQAAVQAWLRGGGNTVGQIVIQPLENGYRLVHCDDAAAIETGSLAWESLEYFSLPEEARAIALYDAAKCFRPLKTAPNLRRGWRLELASAGELQQAIEFFYAAAIGIWVAAQEGRLQCIPLQETLQRQSGMYAVTKKATPEQIATTMISCCNTATGCLKAILWATSEQKKALPAGKFSGEAPGNALPLLCQEACNLFVGALRAEIKK